MSQKIDISDLTDAAILKILIDRERNSIINERQSQAESKAQYQEIRDAIHKYGTDEG